MRTKIKMVYELLELLKDIRPDVTLRQYIHDPLKHEHLKYAVSTWVGYSGNMKYPIRVSEYSPEEEFTQYSRFECRKVLAAKMLIIHLVNFIFRENVHLNKPSQRAYAAKVLLCQYTLITNEYYSDFTLDKTAKSLNFNKQKFFNYVVSDILIHKEQKELESYMFKNGVDTRGGKVPSIKLTMLVYGVTVFDVMFLLLGLVMLVNGIKLI
ncbi:hypothetical protein KNT64_gp015 [Pseudomonas phage PspYZU05]|uniref:Uncharacterized protein n=1 Tax=Pseudomonas phage PspYZU05 TaxID=1983556 RepID=A0A2U7NMX7_9CAUD|nr:hypothetical protein KNT64_gp015 [Pseudomonas phage PspYZU05]ASD51967.1 hypothetical protein PspYZU05_15 [Pseudomonas phage PspYZU05]